jgi:hypothetical protein
MDDDRQQIFHFPFKIFHLPLPKVVTTSATRLESGLDRRPRRGTSALSKRHQRLSHSF